MQVGQGGSELRDYLRVLRHRKGVILVALLTVVGAALATSLLQKKVYQATAELLLSPRNAGALATASGAQSVARSATTDTQIQLIQSAPVRNAVIKKIGSAPPISAAGIGQTDVVQLSALSPQPRMAALIANTYAQAYIDYRLGQSLDDLAAAGVQVQAKINDLQKQIDAIPPQNGPKPDAGLTAKRDGLISQQAVFKGRLDQIQLSSALNSGDAQLVTPASVPTVPVKPTPVRNGLIGALVGLVLGIGLAFLFEYLDDSVTGKEDLERASHGLATLGIIPAVEGWRPKDAPRVVSLSDPTSATAEAYRTLRTATQFMGLDRPMRTIQITSPSAAEGKTTTLANLAVTLANAGQRVVMVDCDLRRPRIHDFFRLGNEVGFTSVLLGELPLREAVQPVGSGDLVLLASGPLPPNPSELLSSHRIVQVLAALQAEADVVLIDSPPVLPVTDAAVLSARMDACLLVTRAGITTRKELGRAVELLRQVDAPVVGTVFNGVSAEDAYGYANRYRYYYRAAEPERRPAAAERA